jgi:hypothetical protein
LPSGGRLRRVGTTMRHGSRETAPVAPLGEALPVALPAASRHWSTLAYSRDPATTRDYSPGVEAYPFGDRDPARRHR